MQAESSAVAQRKAKPKWQQNNGTIIDAQKLATAVRHFYWMRPGYPVHCCQLAVNLETADFQHGLIGCGAGLVWINILGHWLEKATSRTRTTICKSISYHLLA